MQEGGWVWGGGLHCRGRLIIIARSATRSTSSRTGAHLIFLKASSSKKTVKQGKMLSTFSPEFFEDIRCCKLLVNSCFQIVANLRKRTQEKIQEIFPRSLLLKKTVILGKAFKLWQICGNVPKKKSQKYFRDVGRNLGYLHFLMICLQTSGNAVRFSPQN